VSELWTKEEFDVLVFNKFKTLDELCSLIPKRTRESIRKQRKNIHLKDRPALVHVKQKSKIFRVLVIPDAHVTNDQDLSRFTHLAKLIKDKRPDVILFGGDFADMLSLNFFDRNNKLSVEGRRYKLEIDTCNKALDILLSYKDEIRDYKPLLVYLIGNHEFRVERYVEANPALSGHMDIVEDLKLKERGFDVVPYKKFREIYGTLFTHVPLNAAGQPISGKFATQKASDLTSKSLVFFHTHFTGEFNCQRHGDDELIQVYNAGCFFEGDPPGGYADDTPHANVRCVSLLHFCKEGRFDIEQFSIDRLKAEFI